ncbi:MAG TPA: efflux RND transporter periplasmic adaptor subunit [Armatimonadota bacterium]|jgi:RND family efflux transporter MFP subunit
MKRPVLYIAPIVALALIGGFAKLTGSRPKPKPVITQSSLQRKAGIPVTAVKVRMADVDDQLEVTGQLAAESVVNLSTKVSGKVLYVAAREGDNVRAGQVVIQLDDANARGQLEQAEAGVREARAAIRTAQTRLASARTTASVGDVQNASAVSQSAAALRSAKAQMDQLRTGARRQERAEAKGQVDIARWNLEKAESDYKRYQDLYREKAVSAATLDQYRTAMNVARSQHDNAVQAASLTEEGSRTEELRRADAAVQSAQEQLRSAKAAQATSLNRRQDIRSALAGVEQAQAQYASALAARDIAQQNVADFRIRAPRSGSVTGRNLEPGQYVQPGGTLLTIVDLGGVYLSADVSETDIRRVRAGQVVNVHVDALGDRTWQGRLTTVVASADPSSRSFTAKVRIANQDHTLRPNMFATAGIVTGRLRNALLVPKAAVFQQGGKKVVACIVDGAARIAPVSTGIASGTDIVVQSDALHASDSVIVSGQENLTNGQKVKAA